MSIPTPDENVGIRRSTANVPRGLLAAAIGAAVAVVAPTVVIAAYLFLSWQIDDARPFERRDDVRWWSTYAVPPLVGIALYLELTAWATYTPTKNCGFAKTLAIVFFTAMPVTLMLVDPLLPPPRMRSVDLPWLSPSFILLLFLPPFVIASVLIVVRCAKDAYRD